MARLGSWACLLLAGAVAAQAPGTVRVRGRAVDADGTPIAGAAIAEVSAELPLTREVLASPATKSDAAGAFALDCEPSQSGVRLVIAAADHISYQIHAPAPEAGDPPLDLGEVVLPAGTTLFGRVRDPDGHPLAGVRISVVDLLAANGVPGLPDQRLAAVAASDERGIFRLEGIPPAGLQLVFDHGVRTRISPVSNSTPLDVELPRTAECRGRVLGPTGEPIQATVTARFENGDYSSVSTSEDGSFALPLPQGLRYRVSAWSEELGAQCWSAVQERACESLDLRFPSTAGERVLEVRAVAAGSGEAIEHFAAAVVWDHPHGMHPGHHYQFARAVESRNGVLLLAPPATWQPGRGVLHVRAEGRAEAIVPLDAPRKGAPPPLQVELGPERVVAGTVVDHEGRAVAGARVWPMPVPDGSLGYGYIPGHAVTTNASGQFRLAGLGERRYAVQAFVPGQPVPRAHVVDLADSDVAGLRIELVKPLRFTARFEGDLSGRGWWFALRPRGGGASSPATFSHGASDRLGPLSPGSEFTAQRLSPGPHTMVALRRAKGRVPYPLEFELGNTTITEDTKTTVQVGGLRTGQIEGTIEGVLQPEVLDRLVVTVGNARRSFLGSGGENLEDLAAGGHFRLELTPGDYELAMHDLVTRVELWRAGEPLEVKAGATVKVHIRPTVARIAVQLERAEGTPRLALQNLGIEVRDRTHYYSLLDDPRSVLLLAPPGEVNLTLRRCAGALAAPARFGGASVLERRITAAGGEETTLVLREPPRPATADLSK